MAKQKLFYFQAYDQRQQWQKGSLVAQSKQAAQFQLIAKGFSQIRLQQDWQLNQKPKNAEISALLNQLATLLSSAIPAGRGGPAGPSGSRRSQSHPRSP